MGNPMEDIHALLKRVAEEVSDLSHLVSFAVLPQVNGPDIISCSFRVKGDALKSGDEIATEQLEDDFFSVLGDMTAEVNEDGSVMIEGGEEAPDEETVEDREAREALRNERLKKILGSMKKEDDDA